MGGRSNPRLRLAESLGYEVHAGSKHWHAIHSITGDMVIIPFSSRTAAHNDRNLKAELRRKARAAGLSPFENLNRP
jgi:hypothetical protein